MAASSDPYYNVSADLGGCEGRADWMSRLGDDCRLSGLSIPGTHASIAVTPDSWWSTQSWTLDLQYLAGIRYVDIRCRLDGDKLVLYHGIKKQPRDFRAVLLETSHFLDSHGSETIFMRVRQYEDDDMERFENCFRSLMQSVGQRVYTGSTLPELGVARGKIIILQDFVTGEDIGLPWRRWVKASAEERLESLDTGLWDKWRRVKNALNRASQQSPGQLYMTSPGGSGLLRHHKEVAQSTNEKLWHFLRENPGQRRWGIVAMDYPGQDLISRIIDSNPFVR